jgi:hypothetical protein
MMTTFLWAIIAFCLVGHVFCWWGLRCNNKTLAQSLSLLNQCKTAAEFRALERVSYNRHFWRLFFFRDPIKLYRDAGLNV